MSRALVTLIESMLWACAVVTLCKACWLWIHDNRWRRAVREVDNVVRVPARDIDEFV